MSHDHRLQAGSILTQVGLPHPLSIGHVTTLKNQGSLVCVRLDASEKNTDQ